MAVRAPHNPRNPGRTDTRRRPARILLTRPDNLTASQHQTLAGLTTACPEMTALASLITSFAALLTPAPGNDSKLAPASPCSATTSSSD